ncbi:MAG TPA: carboxypeptidase-like regulatory domain-containing protein, partial [Vicinamibacterales bacterium]|nr:carboxypeptidase-like regulatory domain-containing protein [Vicinamibacterales bacterium]
MRKLCLVIMTAIACLIADRAAAQETTGAIAGRIVDQHGLALPGVTVTTTGSQGAKTVATDVDGRYAIPFLTPGAYAVHAELQGFMSIDRAEVQVRVGATVQLTFTMQIGGVAETIDV